MLRKTTPGYSVLRFASVFVKKQIQLPVGRLPPIPFAKVYSPLNISLKLKSANPQIHILSIPYITI